MKQNKISPEWAADRERLFEMIQNVNPTQETTGKWGEKPWNRLFGEGPMPTNLLRAPRFVGRVHTDNFTRREYRSRTVRVGLLMYTLRPLRRVSPVQSDHIGRCSQWTRTVRVGLALQCECSSGRVGYGSDAPSAHVCRLTYFYPLH